MRDNYCRTAIEEPNEPTQAMRQRMRQHRHGCRQDVDIKYCKCGLRRGSETIGMMPFVLTKRRPRVISLRPDGPRRTTEHTDQEGERGKGTT